MTVEFLGCPAVKSQATHYYVHLAGLRDSVEFHGNTLPIGDHVFVGGNSCAPRQIDGPLLPYRYIKRGDIVVFFSPRNRSTL